MTSYTTYFCLHRIYHQPSMPKKPAPNSLKKRIPNPSQTALPALLNPAQQVSA